MITSLHHFFDQEFHDLSANTIRKFQKLKQSTCVITGGAGFVGQWLATLIEYLNRHHGFDTKIVLIDKQFDLLQQTRPDLCQNNAIELLKLDVRNIQELPNETNWVIHAAASPDTRMHASNPCEVMSVITDGTAAILKVLARCSHLHMCLNISSGLIYGHQELDAESIGEKMTAAVNCASATSSYAEAKRYAETLCQAYRSQYKLPVVTVRPFTFMGPFQSLNGPWALNSFIKDALMNNCIRVLGDGKTLRSYMYASDMAIWILTILLNAESGEVFNVGQPEGVHLGDLANLIKTELHQDLPIQLNMGNFNPMYHLRFVPNVDLAMKRFELSIKHNLIESLQKTLDWYKQKINTGIKEHA